MFVTTSRFARLSALISLCIALVLPLVGEATEADEHYEQAAISFGAGHYNETLIHLKNVLQLDANHLPARVLAGETYLKLRIPGAAEAELSRAEALGADSRIVHPKLAEALLAQLKYERVIEEIKPIGDGSHADSEIHSARGRALLELGRYEDADQAFVAATEAQPNSAVGWLGQADVRIRTGVRDVAARLVEKALSADPESGPAWHLKGDLQRTLGNLDEAMTSYERSINFSPERLDVRVSRAVALIELGRDSEALQDIEFVEEKSPNHALSSYLRGLILKRQGDETGAREAFKSADKILSSISRDLVEKHAPSLFLLAVTRLDQGNLEQAESFLRRLYRLRPGHVQGRKLLAGLLMIGENPEEALDLLEELPRTLPDDLELFVLLAEIQTRLGNLGAAERYYLKSLELVPDSPGIYLRLSEIYVESHLPDAATAGLIQAYLRKPDDMQSAIKLGHLLIERGDYDRAIKLGRQIEEMLPESPIPINLVGSALLEKGEAEMAEREFERAIELTPSYATARLNLAKIAQSRGQMRVAEHHYVAILDRFPDHFYALVGMAEVARATGRSDDEITMLEKLEASDENALPHFVRLMDLYAQKGRPELGAPLLAELQRLYPDDSRAMITSAKLSLRMGQHEEAGNTLRNARSVTVDQPEILVDIAIVQLQVGDFDEARFTLEQALRESPGLIPAHSVLVKLDMRIGNWEGAHLRAATLRNSFPENPLGDILLGDISNALGQPEEALLAYEAALGKRADPTIAAKVFFKKRQTTNPTAALRCLEGWAEGRPDDQLVRRLLALGYLDAGEFEMAREAHEWLVQHDTKDARVLNNLAMIYEREGDSRAIELAERAYAQAPDNAAVLDTLGWILVQRGDSARGLDLLRQSYSRDSRHPTVLYHLAVALTERGSKTEARQHLERALAQGRPFDEQAQAEALMGSLPAP